MTDTQKTPPSVDQAFALVLQEEQQREMTPANDNATLTTTKFKPKVNLRGAHLLITLGHIALDARKMAIIWIVAFMNMVFLQVTGSMEYTSIK